MKYTKPLIAILVSLAVAGTQLLSVPVTPKFGNTTESPIEEKIWNGRILKSGINRTAEIHGKEVNYLSANGFKTIDPTFTETPEGFEVLDAPFETYAPLTADGVARFVNNNRFDIRTKETITETPLTLEIQAEGVNPVPGVVVRGDLVDRAGLQKNISYVLYEGAYPSGADLIYYVHTGPVVQLEKLVRMKSESEFVANPSFKLRYSSDVEFSRKVNNTDTRWTKSSQTTLIKTGLSVKQSEKRGASFKDFKIWDSGAKSDERKEQKIDVKIDPKNTDGWYTLTKILPSSFLDGATFPVYTDSTVTVYPDASPETTSVDGGAGADAVDRTWTNTRNLATGDDASDGGTSQRIFIRSNNAGTFWRYMWRGFLLFDTSVIGSGQTVNSATLSLFGDSDCSANDYSQSLAISGPATPASNTVITTADYDQAGATDMATAQISMASWSMVGYNDYTLAAAGIANVNPIGVSKFGVRTSGDISNTEPSLLADKSSCKSYATAETALTTSDPKLVVDYTAAGGGAAPEQVWFPDFVWIPRVFASK